jgi:hypothetical protein
MDLFEEIQTIPLFKFHKKLKFYSRCKEGIVNFTITV